MSSLRSCFLGRGGVSWPRSVLKRSQDLPYSCAEEDLRWALEDAEDYQPAGCEYHEEYPD